MRPTFSVIFFTTLTGAGYGLLAWASLLAALGLVPPDRWLGLMSIGVALVLITLGLLASTFHLGRPERAWRAFSQWRTSWLSREGVASVATYLPAAILAVSWIFFGRTDGALRAVGLCAAACACLTVCATGMIYASLKPIAQWSNWFTMPGYLVYALMTGSVLLDAILHLWRPSSSPFDLVVPVIIVLAWGWKTASWRYNDALPSTSLNSALGLSKGKLRSIEWPHTEENYVLKEMGFEVARRHAAKLRRLVHLDAFALPLLATLATLFLHGRGAAVPILTAVILQIFGILVERWLFFAEAKHTVASYYGR
jgi:sulfite dehydrogenase (quinone) subunit SoeC